MCGARLGMRIPGTMGNRLLAVIWDEADLAHYLIPADLGIAKSEMLRNNAVRTVSLRTCARMQARPVSENSRPVIGMRTLDVLPGTNAGDSYGASR